MTLAPTVGGRMKRDIRPQKQDDKPVLYVSVPEATNYFTV